MRTPFGSRFPEIRLSDLVTSTARLSDDTLELVDLGLGTAEGTESLLSELTGTLVLGVAEQLDDSALVGGEASNLLDNLANESGALAQVTLGSGNTGLDNTGGGFVALVEANGQTGLRGGISGHFCWMG